ncbi:MAG: bifunctional (p)ppGpp synthetase/guanosine-3',5'-bis(diphosphate) 3'-pyrophosphohydrolase [Clostridiales bacterium]|nr:bifunctional (p)ppGpp synthetase/guanosine-3',5'-bis(diphosphate) 3'-pyrophosphohydrolase [Clostridiales bacterium]
MTNNLSERIIKKYSEVGFQKVCNIFDNLKSYYNENTLYSVAFAESIANNIITNRLDIDSVIIGLIYPAYKNNPNIINENFISTDIKNIFLRLEKIENLNLSTHQEQLENIKNMFIALAKDIRVVIIKLCIEDSKLDFLSKLSDDEINKFMQEVTDVYFPICQMLGLSQIKNSFGNATFKYFKPNMYQELNDTLSKYIHERNEKIDEVIKNLKTEMIKICPSAVVYGRQKQLYSIAKKLQSKNMGISSINDIYGRNDYLNKVVENSTFKENRLNQIMDILAVRILVDTVEECYTALGKVFTMYNPLGNFKDYIANPKENGYQSLHTAIILDNGDPVEVQIRTFDMHTYAEYGFAAHWAYKEKKKVDESGVKINYIRSILDLHKDKSSDELLEIMKTDVYSGKIFVQSPMGKILDFPDGATPIDFAYAIHSKIGNTCVGAKINGRMVPLTTMLNNGDIVEIITNPNAKGPSRDWLKVVKTSSAKSKINAFFKKEMKEENIKKGKSILENNAKIKNLPLSKYLVNDYLEPLFEKYSFQNIDDMYASVGYGGINANQILNKLKTLYNDDHKEIENNQEYKLTDIKNQGEIDVKGFSNFMTKLAKCCNPLPGDDIIGYISRGNGITIHRRDCESLKNYEFERLIECSWKNKFDKDFIGSISIIAPDVTGIISKITKKFNDEKVPMVGLNVKKMTDGNLSISIQVSIKDKSELDNLISKLSQSNLTLDVYRSV